MPLLKVNGHFQSFFIFFSSPDPKSDFFSRKSTNKKILAQATVRGQIQRGGGGGGGEGGRGGGGEGGEGVPDNMVSNFCTDP